MVGVDAAAVVAAVAYEQPVWDGAGVQRVRDTMCSCHLSCPHGEQAIPHVVLPRLPLPAAGLALLVMGNKYSQTKESTIGADVVDYRSKSDICRALAKEQFNLYDKAIGKKEEATAAAIIREYDTTYPWGGELLTHPPRWR